MADIGAGSEVGGYRLEEHLGGGGFGEVWRATEIESGRVVAIKILSGRYGADDTERLRVDVELLAVAAVGHDPNIVTVYGGATEPVPYLVMEYVAGENLAVRLGRMGRLSVAETVKVGRAVASALVALGRSGIVHRDLKAANVLLGKDGSIKLADFGIAKIVGFDSLTKSGQLPMSLHYAAPEVWDGKADEPADRYAYGVLLYECLAGHPPFHGGYAAVYRGHRELPPDLGELPADCPGALRSLIADCLEKDPKRRPPDAESLLDRIESVAAGLPPTVPETPPTALGPWRLLERHPTQRWAWRASQGDRAATVEVVFGDMAVGEALRRAVAASPDLARLGAERLLGSNRLILRPGEAWPADAQPGGPFAFWVARDELPVPSGLPPLDRPALEKAVAAVLALTEAAAEHEVALDLGPERLSVLPDGNVFVRRPGIPDPAGSPAEPDASALLTLAGRVGPELRKTVSSAGSLAALAGALGGAASGAAATVEGDTVPSRTVRVDRAGRAAEPSKVVAPSEPRRRRRRAFAAGLVFALAAIVALSALGVWVLARGNDASPSPSLAGISGGSPSAGTTLEVPATTAVGGTGTASATSTLASGSASAGPPGSPTPTPTSRSLPPGVTATPFVATSTPAGPTVPGSTPTPTPTPTPKPPTPVPPNPILGDGRDGALILTASRTEYPVDSPCAGTAYTKTLSAPNGSFAAGQLVLVIQSQGAGVGHFEVNWVAADGGGVLTLRNALAYSYTTGAQVLVMPQYTDVTVYSGVVWTVKPWNGSVGGVLAFAASGTVTIEGVLSADGRGYRAGAGAPIDHRGGSQGEGQAGAGSETTATNGAGGGGGGHAANYPWSAGAGGGGGGNTGAGQAGYKNGGANTSPPGAGGQAYSAASLITFGGGGGGGGGDEAQYGAYTGRAHNGGSGGGAVVLFVRSISVTGGITARGAGGEGGSLSGRAGGGGGGAGGTVYVRRVAGSIAYDVRGGPGSNDPDNTYEVGGSGGDGHASVVGA